MHGISPQLHHVCGACTPPQSHPPSAGPHTSSLSWHRSCACYEMSFPCASAGPCPHPACKPIYWGTHGGWQKCEAACLPHHTAQGRCPQRTARVCISPLPLDPLT